MPYINKEQREELESVIDVLSSRIADLCENNGASFAGLLNYSACETANRVIAKRGQTINYDLITSVVGTLRNAADEYYHKVGRPYEDLKISENGDLDWPKKASGDKMVKYGSDNV